jgi:hypothetical protein
MYVRIDDAGHDYGIGKILGTHGLFILDCSYGLAKTKPLRVAVYRQSKRGGCIFSFLQNIDF